MMLSQSENGFSRRRVDEVASIQRRSCGNQMQAAYIAVHRPANLQGNEGANRKDDKIDGLIANLLGNLIGDALVIRMALQPRGYGRAVITNDSLLMLFAITIENFAFVRRTRRTVEIDHRPAVGGASPRGDPRPFPGRGRDPL